MKRPHGRPRTTIPTPGSRIRALYDLLLKRKTKLVTYNELKKIYPNYATLRASSDVLIEKYGLNIKKVKTQKGPTRQPWDWKLLGRWDVQERYTSFLGKEKQSGIR